MKPNIEPQIVAVDNKQGSEMDADQSKQTVIKIKITPRSAKTKLKHEVKEQNEIVLNNSIGNSIKQTKFFNNDKDQDRITKNHKEIDINDITQAERRNSVTDWLRKQNFGEKEEEALAKNVNYSNNNDVIGSLDKKVTLMLEEKEKRPLSTPLSDFERYEIASIRKRYPSANKRDEQIVCRMPKNQGYLDSLRFSFDQIRITGTGLNRDRHQAWTVNRASTSKSAPSAGKQAALPDTNDASALMSCTTAIADLKSQSQRRKFNISIVDLDYSGSQRTTPSGSTQSMPPLNPESNKSNYYYLHSLSNRSSPAIKSGANIGEKKSRKKHMNAYTCYSIVNQSRLPNTDYASQIRQTSIKLDSLARRRRNIPMKITKGQPGHVEIRMYRKALHNGQLTVGK